MKNKLSSFFLDPRIKNIDVNTEALLEQHEKIIQEKPLLRSAFNTFYKDMINLCDSNFDIDGIEVELGSGAGFFKKERPGLITSDVRKSRNIDMELNAVNMNLPDSSVRSIYMINVFHHLPSVTSFFNEALRVLKPGGGIILVEPHIGFFSAWLHSRLHQNEYFNPDETDWDGGNTGAMSGANQAKAYIVFERDREKYEKLFGERLKIVYSGYELNALRYLLSGGLNFRSLLPGFLGPMLSVLEKMGSPLAPAWSLHKIYVIKKMASALPHVEEKTVS